ncbi:MAG: AAA family ATPase [Planctomycetota bacterium]
MFIERIEAEKFGALDRVVIDGLGPGVQVLHGTNETGKTTLLEFVRAIFFGFEGNFRRGVLDPRLPCAGRLLVRVPPERTLLAIERRHEGPHLAELSQSAYDDGVVGLGGDEGDLIEITDIDPRHSVGGVGPRHRYYLQDIVGGIDETTFTSVMAFGLDELHELRTLEPEGCGSRLYELASGLDRSHVARVIAHLRDAIARLDSADPDVSPLTALKARRAALAERFAAAGAPALAAGGLWSEAAHLDAEIAGLLGRIERSEKAEAVVRGVIAIEPLHRAWKQTAARLAALESVPLVHPDRDAWRSAARKLRRAERLAKGRKKYRAKYARQLRELAPESIVWSKRAAIAALADEEPRLERLAADVARAESHAKLAARRFGEQVGIAGLSRLVPVTLPSEFDVDSLPEVLLPEGFALSFGPLRSRARDCSRASRALAAAKKELVEARRSLGTTRGTVDGAERTLGGITVQHAIDQAAEKLASLRKRLSAGDQLAELDRTITRLEGEMAESLDAQLIPVPLLVALGGLFVIGTGMLLSGSLLPREVTGSLAYAMAALGALGAGVASITTWSLDRNASARLEASRRQYEMVKKQRDELAEQCGLLDGRLGPDSTTSLDRRLAAAQAELDRLEELASREGSVHLLADRVAAAEQAVKRAAEDRAAAKARWRKALEHRGLPTNLSPREVRQIAAHRHTLLTLDDDRRRLSEEARHKREELAAAGRRIDELLVECELVPESTPLEHLRILKERLDADRALVRRRASLTRRLESARRRHRDAVRQVKVVERAVREFYVRWGVANQDEFLTRVDRRPEYEQLRLDAEAAERDWQDARRRTTEPAELDQWLADAAAVSLESRLAEACDRTARHRTALAEARERRAAVGKRLEAAAADRGNEAVQAELAAIEQLVAEQQERRRVLERARILLEETRAAVARDHQPPVLREASRWLARLTEGRYLSITTAVDEARLEIHEQDGQVWKPERLSRGTREQVFLALRLALVRDLGRHDVSLPVVMDDALVNFDDTRARAAARTLVEFLAEQGADRQMLVFTCHAHVATMFHEAGAHVRSLSDPSLRWSRLPEPAALPAPKPARRPPKPKPALEPEPAPPPVVEVIAPPPSADLWPAEAFFFGGPEPDRASKPVRSEPAAAKPPRRHAARTRRHRL